MHMLDRRLQVLVDAERYARLEALAKERGTSIGAIVREAIDRGLSDPASRRADAGRRLLAADAMPVPADPAELRAELDAARRHEP